MPGITLRVLDGADRGRRFESLAPPITIGREEGNSIQLNDDRVSRYHVKIQEDHDRLVLTDLESTNGTKVNGEDIQLRILRFGDMITVGRSVLLFGTRDQIAGRLRRKKAEHDDLRATIEPEDRSLEESSYDFELNLQNDSQLQATLHALDPPELPDRLSPGQAAQTAEMLEYFHVRVRQLLASVQVDDDSDVVSISAARWQGLAELQATLANYLKEIGNPHSR